MSEKKVNLFIEDFGKSKVFGIWEVDDKGEKVSKFPVVSLGKVKLKALMKYEKELKKFIEEKND